MKRQWLLEDLFINTPHAVLAVDDQFHIFDLNPAATTFLGLSKEQVVGQQCSHLMKCRNMNRTLLCGTSNCPVTRVVQQKQPIKQEELILGRVQENSNEFSCSIAPVEHEQSTYVVFGARDVSGIKTANRVQTNFVSMVSHELRTPLNSVHGFVDLLLQGYMGALNEEQRKYLGYVQDGVQQLVSTVEDILLLTRSDSGQFEIKREEVDIALLSHQVVTALQPQAHKAGVIINEEIPDHAPLLCIDPQRMKQVLNNLVINALKFTPAGGSVTIRVRPCNERWVVISVADSGYGIPIEDQPHIFERFYQSNHDQQSKMGGYGLGLSIAKLIVEQHGGEIRFESVLNKGTTFFFTAPLV
ncbi:MAG TPA: ATP-binding protein [Ktedonobacteraceae bacterium]|nr:ATP-binding protein [Ktedonobacteraceae bacterium]